MKPKNKQCKASCGKKKESVTKKKSKPAILSDNPFVSGEKILSLARKQLQDDHEEESGAVGGKKIITGRVESDHSDEEIFEEDNGGISDEEMALDDEDADALRKFYPRDPRKCKEEETLLQFLPHGARIGSDAGGEISMPPPAVPKSNKGDEIHATASGGTGGTWISLGELLQERVTDARTEIESQMTDMSRASSVISPELLETFQALRQVLKNYTHGQIPKLLKQLPHMRNCQDVVEELQPESWTSGAIAVMTKFFVAKGGDVAAYYLTDVLLPRIRDHIADNGKLNPTLIEALHRALFVTKIFFTSFLIPLIQDRRNPCSLAEATVIAGLLKKARVNPKYGGAALYLIANESYSSAQIIFLRTLLDKNYKLLDPILEKVHCFFMRFAHVSEREEEHWFTDEGRMPVVWFQTLLLYVQMYKDFWSNSEEKCKDLIQLCRVHFHPSITNAIRREIITATATTDDPSVEMEDAS